MFFYPHLSSLWLYFNFVAIPPLICLSALFSSNMFLTSCANIGFILSSLSLTSLCTVLLLTPNFLAAPLTVYLLSILYKLLNYIKKKKKKKKKEKKKK